MPPAFVNCLVYGDDPVWNIIPVKFSPKETSIGELKGLIKKAFQPRFDGVIVTKLSLWKVNISKEEVSTLGKDFSLDSVGKLLPSLNLVQDEFPNPNRQNLHVIVVPPQSGK